MKLSWRWVIGMVFLLAICDGDDDGPRQYCYDFASGKTLCFDKPLPEDKYCYAGKDDTVTCYDQPQTSQ